MTLSRSIRQYQVIPWIVVVVLFLLSCHRVTSAETPQNKHPTVVYKWSVRQLPKSRFRADRHLKLTQEDVTDFDSIPLRPDQVLVRVEAFSIDAFLRTLLIRDSFHLALKPGDCMRATGYGTVLRAGSNQAFTVGSRVLGILPVTNFAVVEKSPFLQSMPSLPGVPPSRYLDLLGMSGLSAYMGLFRATNQPPQTGETVVISAAAGGVGTCAVQMAQRTGARVVGVTGGPQKVAFLLDQLGVDAAIDYKDTSRGTLGEQLAQACPDGIDFFLDNVGGSLLDTVLDQINVGARVVICGAISQYDTGKLYTNPQGPKNYLKLAERSATMSGFALGHYLESPRNIVAAMRFILWNYWRGKLKPFVQVEKGIDSFGPAIEKLLNGENTGRLIVDVTGDL